MDVDFDIELVRTDRINVVYILNLLKSAKRRATEEEKKKDLANPAAMKAAIAAAFPSIAGSAMTTFAGLACLAFMRFRLGADMGFALAKSVLVSLVCILTVMPALILISDPWIEKTRKKALHIPMTGYSRLLVRSRFLFPILFAALFVGAFFLKNSTEILYMLQTNNPIDAVFAPHHSLVLLYETKDSGRIAEALAPLEEDEKVIEITGYYNTVSLADYCFNDYVVKSLEELLVIRILDKQIIKSNILSDAGSMSFVILIPSC